MSASRRKPRPLRLPRHILLKQAVVFVLLCLTCGFWTFADEQVTILPTETTLSVRNNVFHNDEARYKLFEYKGVVYYPLSYQAARWLGLQTTWDAQEGLSIVSDSAFFSSSYDQGTADDPTDMLATVVTFPVKIHGEVVQNSTYPFLMYQGIVYMPLIWDYCVNRFQWSYTWSAESGITIWDDPFVYLRAHHVDVDSALDTVLAMEDTEQREFFLSSWEELARQTQVQAVANGWSDEQIQGYFSSMVGGSTQVISDQADTTPADDTPEDPGTAVIPEFQEMRVTALPYPIRVNGVALDNDHMRYPCILYDNIAYFPLSYQAAPWLGFQTAWDAETGLSLTAYQGNYIQSIVRTPDKTDSPDTDTAWTAHTVDFPIQLQGKYISDTDYPFLVFRDVVYMPLTWNYCVNHLGWLYSWTAQDGLSLVCLQRGVVFQDGYYWQTNVIYEDDGSWTVMLCNTLEDVYSSSGHSGMLAKFVSGEGDLFLAYLPSFYSRSGIYTAMQITGSGVSEPYMVDLGISFPLAGVSTKPPKNALKPA